MRLGTAVLQAAHPGRTRARVAHSSRPSHQIRQEGYRQGLTNPIPGHGAGPAALRYPAGRAQPK